MSVFTWREWHLKSRQEPTNKPTNKQASKWTNEKASEQKWRHGEYD